MATRSKSRDSRIVAAVACPLCQAKKEEPCRNPHPHQLGRGPQDRREQPGGPHKQRRLAWIAWKQAEGII